MIAYTTLLLFCIGVFSSINVGVKVDKLLSFLTFTSVFLVFANFFDNMFNNIEHTFSFMWNSSPSGDIVVDIISNPYNCGLVMPFFLMALITIGNNISFRYEERRSAFDAVVIMNLISLIMIITSNNLVQLLSAVFIIDILAVFIAKDLDASRKYVKFNILADMMLFMVFAVINYRVASLELSEILEYRKSGLHVDFIAIFGLTVVFMKMGFFLFQGGLLGLKNVRFHRLQTVLFLTSPAVAILLLIKFHILWSGSAYFVPYINIACISTLAWGFIGFISIDNFKAKVVYLQMMFGALFVELLRFRGFAWSEMLSTVLVCDFLLISTLYLAYYCTNRKKLVSQMANLQYLNVFPKIVIVGLSAILIAILANALDTLYTNANRYYIWAFAVLFLLSIANLWHQIYFSKPNSMGIGVTKVSLKHKKISMIMILLVLAFMLSKVIIFRASVLISLAVFLFLVKFGVLIKSAKLYSWIEMQNIDFISYLYEYLVATPLRFFGRILWILIDWRFVEKFLVETVVMVLQSLVRILRDIHTNKVAGTITIVVIILLLLLSSYFFRGIYQ